MRIANFSFKITLPDTLYRFAICLLLLYRKIRYKHPYRLIPLTSGLYAKIDPDKYEQLSQYKWHTLKGSRTYGVWYAARSAVINGKTYTIRMHQVIMASQLEQAENKRKSEIGELGSEVLSLASGVLNLNAVP